MASAGCAGSRTPRPPESGTTYPGGQCVQSPNYPNPYPATSSCSIRATFGDGITSALAFEYFETSPGDDYIEINGVEYSGLNVAATVTAVAQAPALDGGRRLTATANAGSGSYPGSNVLMADGDVLTWSESRPVPCPILRKFLRFLPV